MSSPTDKLRYNEKKELEADALFAFYPPIASEAAQAINLLMFPPRDDPAYHQGELGPTEDDLTAAVRAAGRTVGRP